MIGTYIKHFILDRFLESVSNNLIMNFVEDDSIFKIGAQFDWVKFHIPRDEFMESIDAVMYDCVISDVVADHIKLTATSWEILYNYESTANAMNFYEIIHTNDTEKRFTILKEFNTVVDHGYDGNGRDFWICIRDILGYS